MLETKTNLEDSINKWADLLEKIQSINKTVESMRTILNEVSPFQTSMSEKRFQVDKLKALEEKVRCENIEVEGLRAQMQEVIVSGQQNVAASQGNEILDK